LAKNSRRRRCHGLSNDKVLKILNQIGLPQQDAEVYLFLSLKGPKKAEDLAISLQISHLELHIILKRLQEKGFVAQVPALFIALPLERIMDIFAEARLKEAQDISEKKEIILAQWRSLVFRNASRY
jgi:sugar-specific transcriptional regulator TrmB